MVVDVMRGAHQLIRHIASAVAVILVLAAGCTGGTACERIGCAPLRDAATSCDLLRQTGCPIAMKCTWLEDYSEPAPVGHVGCAPNGTQPVGAACAFGPAGIAGYDDCEAGALCVNAACSTFCDRSAPQCPAGTCSSPPFEAPAFVEAGVCE